MPIAHLNIGSNQGNRRANIDRAVALIALRAGRVVARSSFVSSEPWGYESAEMFENQGIDIDTNQPPLELLDTLQLIEKEISPTPHRNTDGSYRDRVIDIDIILYEGVTMDTPRLTIPHPRYLDRMFVTTLLKELRACFTTHVKTMP